MGARVALAQDAQVPPLERVFDGLADYLERTYAYIERVGIEVVRSAVLDVIRLDYVTTARAKGLPERAVILKHVVRNALMPVVTLVALQMPAVLLSRILNGSKIALTTIGPRLR